MNALYLALGIAALLVIAALVILFTMLDFDSVDRDEDRDEDHSESDRLVREIVSSTGPVPLESKRPHIRAGGGKI